MSGFHLSGQVSVEVLAEAVTSPSSLFAESLYYKGLLRFAIQPCSLYGQITTPFRKTSLATNSEKKIRSWNEEEINSYWFLHCRSSSKCVTLDLILSFAVWECSVSPIRAFLCPEACLTTLFLLVSSGFGFQLSPADLCVPHLCWIFLWDLPEVFLRPQEGGEMNR